MYGYRKARQQAKAQWREWRDKMYVDGKLDYSKVHTWADLAPAGRTSTFTYEPQL